jgi:hypothetical protein
VLCLCKQYLEATDVEPSQQGVHQQAAHNLAAFFGAVEQQLQGLPPNCRFGVADLQSTESSEERPQIANCILYIRAACSQQHPQQQQQLPVANLHFEQMPMTPPAPRSAGNSSSGAAVHMQQQQQCSPQQYASPQPPQSAQMAQPTGAFSAGLAMSYMTPMQAGATASMHPVLVSPQPSGSYGYHQHGSGMQQHHMQRSSPAHSDSMPLALVSASPLMAAHGGLNHAGAQAQSSQLAVRSSNSAVLSSSINAAQHKSVQAAAGVTKLMQQCTNMLKERMFPSEQLGGVRYGSPAAPDSAMKALGPVLEGVLGQLTEEYEKRLLTKDHQCSVAIEAKARAEREVEELKVSSAWVHMCGWGCQRLLMALISMHEQDGSSGWQGLAAHDVQGDIALCDAAASAMGMRIERLVCHCLCAQPLRPSCPVLVYAWYSSFPSLTSLLPSLWLAGGCGAAAGLI